LNQGIELPKEVSYHLIDGNHLLIAPEKATWITVSDIGREIVDLFYKGNSIKEVISTMQSKNYVHEDIVSELRSLLIKTEQKVF
jgi:hypothetical protein